jgi:hypothetical protein
MRLSTLTVSVLITLCLAAGALGQEARGTIVGRVMDTSGAVVPGVSVAITNRSTGVAASVQTNDQGLYAASYLIPGTYQVTAEHSGFKRFLRQEIEVRVGDRLELNITLELGSATEQITVVEETPLLETASASMGQVVDARRVADLPLPHGNPFHLIQLAPGANFAAPHQRNDRPFEPTNIVGYAIDGARANRNEVTLDGVPNTSTSETAGEVIASFVPPADAVAEFKVQTATFDAAVGQTEGGVVNISLKSGKNAFHGTAYYVKMAPEMTANTFFGNRAGSARGDFTYNRWGTMAGGPVILPKLYRGRSRTFYMYSYEGIHETRPRGTTLTVPTEPQRHGDSSALLKLGSQYQIYDPATRRTAAGGLFQSDPLPGNVLPASRISPVAKNILSYYPLPTAAGTADFRNNLPLPNEPEPIKYFTHTARLDHNLSDRHRIFGRVNMYQRESIYNDWFKNAASGRWFQFLSRGASFDDVYTLSPHLVMNLRYGYNRFVRSGDASAASRGFDLTTLGLPAAYNHAIDPGIRRFPHVTIAGYASTYNSGVSSMPTDTHSLSGTLENMRGGHYLKAGAEGRLYRENRWAPDNASTGRFDFSTNWTRGPLSSSAASPIGQGLAALLLGLPTGGLVERRDTYAEQSTVWALYLQDDWKLTRRLTLTLGVRYELEGPLTERFNRTVRGFDEGAVLPIEAQAKASYAKSPTPEVPPDRFQVRGGLTFAGVQGLPRTLWERDRNNLMPRVGLAFSAGAKTVVRAGYGIFYGFLGARRGDVIQTGFSQVTNLIPSQDGGLTFVATLANPFPDGIQEPPRASRGAMTYVGQDISFFNAKPRTPYMQRWQLGIQRELPRRVVFETAYVGNRGGSIETARQRNALPIQYLSRTGERDAPLINYLSANLPNPYYPLLPGTGRSGTLIGRASLLTAYPHFTSVSTTTNEGSSWYHGLQSRLERRFAGGYTVQLAYTWSKFMEAAEFLNDGDAAPARVISSQDYPQRLSLSWIWELPFGPGRRWLAQTHPLVTQTLGGWQVQGIYSAQSGGPLSFGNILFRGNLADVPLPKSQRSAERWLNVNAGFERNTSRALSYNYRTHSLRFAGIRGDGINTWDMSALKDFPIHERVKVQFRAEFLNALNHVEFTDPNTDPYSTAFGTITQEKRYPRSVQLGLKLIY